MGCGCFHHLSQQRIRGHLNEGEQNTTQTPPPFLCLSLELRKQRIKTVSILRPLVDTDPLLSTRALPSPPDSSLTLGTQIPPG